MVKLGQYSKKMMCIHTGVHTKLCLGRPPLLTPRLSLLIVRAAFLFSLLCITAFISQFEGLLSNSHGKWLYRIGFTKGIQMNWVKASIIGSLLCITLKQCFIVKEWPIHSLLPLVMDYVSLLHRKPLINHYIIFRASLMVQK